jgi:hypothetical protein
MTRNPAPIRRLTLVATAALALGLRLSPDLWAQDPAQSASAPAGDSSVDDNRANWKATGSAGPDQQTTHGQNDPQAALDGKRDGLYSFLTDPGTNPWWMVDFGKAIPVWSVTIYNDVLSSVTRDRMKYFRIWLAPDDGSGNPPTNWHTPMNKNNSGFYDNQGKSVGNIDSKGHEIYGGPRTVRIYSTMPGKDDKKLIRYLKIEVYSPNSTIPAVLNLDQVEIKSGTTDPDGPASNNLARPTDGDDLLSGS